MSNIYVFKCTNSKYYIEIDKKSYKNINDELLSKINNEWVKKYKISSILQVYTKCSKEELDKYTEIYMEIYGIDNVRGGSYNKISLDEVTKLYLKYKLNNKNNNNNNNKNNLSKKKKGKISLKSKRNRLLLNNYMYDYNYEDEYEFNNKQRKEIKNYSNNYVNNIINNIIDKNEEIIENRLIENTNKKVAIEVVNNVINECVENINLINEFDIIKLTEEDKINIETEKNNNGYLYNIFSYFSIY